MADSSATAQEVTNSKPIPGSLSTAPSESDNLSRSYENPNYRKLYAKLSMDAMIGIGTTANNNHSEKPQPLSPERRAGPMKDHSEVRPDGPIPTADDPEDLQFFYDEYEEDDEEEDDEEDEYYEDDIEYSPTAAVGVVSSGDTKTKGEQAADSTELPDGWERHEDELGPYFWHIPTGTI